MASWKKVIVSGSIANLSEISASTGFNGDGSGLTNVAASSVANNLTVDNATIQLNSGTTYNGSAARTISVKDGGIDADALAAAVAGDGLTGGGGSALAVGAGTGIDVSSNAIAVDVSDFMSNGINNRIITATGADAMNAETNLTFDGSELALTGNMTSSGTITANGDSGIGFKVNGGGTLYAVAGVVGNEITFGFENETAIAIGRSQNPISLQGPVTASGDVSSSGTITANAFVGDLTGAATNVSNNLTVDNATIQLNSGTTYNGSAARTISIKDGGVDADALAAAVAGNGLTGGGGSALAVGAGNGIDVSSNAIAVDVSDFMSAGANNRLLTATGTDAFQGESKLTFDGAELNVLGNISASGTLQVDTVISGSTISGSFVGDGSGITGITSDSTTGTLSVDNSTLQLNSGTQFNGSADRTISIKAGGVTGDQLATSIAGDGLTGGGGSALAVGAGTGIDVSANAIAVDVSDFMSNGSNNRILTATGADAQNAEANLTFDGSTLTVTGDASISGDLTVSGDVVSLNAANLNVEDKFILLNSGSTSGDGGVIVQTGTNGIGTAMFYDDSLKRWGLAIEDGTAWNATSTTADYHINAVSQSGAAPTGNPYGFGADAGSRRGLMVIDTSTEDIYIYS